jgi:glycosyltransferase involved in cell wall biosynthesis
MNHKRIIVVLGMHRSGTSALTRGLEALGVGLGTHLNPANFANPKGYWEDEDVMALNEALLRRLGSAYDGLALISPEVLLGNDYVDLREEARMLLQRKLNGASIWAFKDPRTARLLPFWQKVFADLDLHHSYVISVRHPISVAQSLARRDEFAPVKSYYLWLEHLLGALTETSGCPRIVVDYDALLSQPDVEIARIADALQLPQPGKAELDAYAHDFLDTDLRHTRYSEADLVADADMPQSVTRLYALLQRLAGRGEAVPESELDTTLSETMAQWRSLIPVLRHLSKLDANMTVQRQTSHLQNEEIAGLRRQLLALAEERNNARDSIEAYQRDISAYEKQAARFVAEIQDDERRLALLDAEIARLSAAAAHETEEKEKLQQSTKALQDSLRTLHSEHRATVQQLEAIKASRSWRFGRTIARLNPRKALGGQPAQQPESEGDLWASRPELPADFDPWIYSELNPDVAAAGMNPIRHYLEFGISEGRPYKKAAKLDKTPIPSSAQAAEDDQFDAEYYVANNPDVARAGVDPYQHYLVHGRAEGRLGRALKIDNTCAFDQLDPAKETILLVGHEASRTGAPVLTLNIARAMLAKYNVIVMLLGPGPLANDMSAIGAIVIGPFPSLRGDPAHAAPVMEAITQACRIKFALTNSIVAAAVLPELARRGIPAVALIHEFASYTRPRDAFLNAALWANALVFSARLTMESAIGEVPGMAARHIRILPQGRCTLPGADLQDPLASREAAELKRRIRGNADAEHTVVVLGLGTVQLRKGVDLFIACAERMVRQDPDTNYRFIWIGAGFDPDGDLHYSVYLADQIRRSGLTGRLHILPETAHIEAAYASADLLVLSSRLDPLPNVGIDAMYHGLPVICFDNATGIADVLRDAGLADECVAPYLDIDAMATKVTALARSETGRAQLAERMRDLVDTRFSMAGYVDELEKLALMHVDEAASERRVAEALAESGLLNRSFMLPPDLRGLDDAEAAAFYVRTWATGIRCRKPFPGFHPGIYREMKGLPDCMDPFLHYIESGRPSGPWLFEVISDRDKIAPVAPSTRVALHLHVYYVDLLAQILSCLRRNQLLPDLFVSVPSQAVADDVAVVLAAYPGKIARIAVVPNRGRDIGPFLTEFGHELVSGYDIVGHMHTKKTTALAQASVGRLWFSFLLANMLGGSVAMADRIVSRMAGDPTIGMVFPDDPNVCGWDANLRYAEPIADRLQLGLLPAQLNFPVGTMFWARASALRPFVDLGLDWDSYPCEPLGYDGSVLHALERLFPLAIRQSGLRVLVAYCNGTGR